MTVPADTPVLSEADLRWRPYRLCAQSQLAIDPPTALPPGWTPDVSVPLDDALPFPWDEDYRVAHAQAFQPVRFWQNATALAALVADARARGTGAEDAEEMLIALVKRMRDYIRKVDGARFIENRFTFSSAGMKLPYGWVSGIANAFVILGCVAAVQVLPGRGLEEDVRRLADAYARIFAEGSNPPDPWISYRDRNGFLWFEEYPEPGGQPNLVLNGHIFAVFALFRASGFWPGHGYAEMAQAGAATVEAYVPLFRRKGKVNIYALRGQRRSDYLPLRTIRQQYQLYQLTGSMTFLAHARAFRQDMAELLTTKDHTGFDRLEAVAMERRRWIDEDTPTLEQGGWRLIDDPGEGLPPLP
ncbi:D-glucuronyl C5-epimerase family protein [Rhodobacteraceae bacterium D3-12]|nr:D-glucuronyl C5-epimerase family protein [Rhodobacteraceae bacterium D3-12]